MKHLAHKLPNLALLASLAAAAAAATGCGDAGSADGEAPAPELGTATEAFDPSQDPNSAHGHVRITLKAMKLLEARGMLPDILKSPENQALVVYGNNFGDRTSAGWPNGGRATTPITNRISARIPRDSNFDYQSSLDWFEFDAVLNDFPWDDPTIRTTGAATIAWVPGRVDPDGDFLSDSLRLIGKITVHTKIILDVPLSGLSCAGALFGASECKWVEPDPTTQDLGFSVDNLYHYSYGDLRDIGVAFNEADTALRFYPFFKEHVPGHDGNTTQQDAATKLSNALRGQTLLGGSDYGAQKYGSILYQVARRFFAQSSQPEPDLAQLIKVGNDVPGWHTGRMQGHGGLNDLTLDFPHTYLGGMPYVCGRPSNSGDLSTWATTADPCAVGTPTWPAWIKNAPPQTEADLQALEVARPGRSDRAGLIYLGWAVHMMQDSAVPHHVAGWTGKEHAFQDALGDKAYYYTDFGGVTVPGPPRCTSGSGGAVSLPSSKLGPSITCTPTRVPHPYAQYSNKLVDKVIGGDLDALLGPVGAKKSRGEICQSLNVKPGDGSSTDLNWRAVYPLYLDTARQAYQSRQEQIPAAGVVDSGLAMVKNAVLGSIKLMLCGTPGEENLALNKPSWQSSDLPGYGAVAARANDGNTEGNFWVGSVTHTNSGLVYPTQPHMAGQHWYVYLSPNNGPERRVTTIKIHNRTDCCSERLSHYNVLAWNSADEEWQVISNHANDTTSGSTVTLQVDALTRYVMIAKTDDNYLSLAEVEVFGN